MKSMSSPLLKPAVSLTAVTACALLACSGAPPGASDGNRSERWQERYDFTGDGVNDRIEISYSGGGHCCYTVAIVDGKSGGRIELPFELDGGYPSGMDLSQPERFAIEEGREGRPARLVLEVATYNGEPEQLPDDGFGLGVTSHRIAVTLAEGKPRVENLGWRCARALTVIQRGSWTAWEGLPADCDPREVFATLEVVPLEITAGALGAAGRPVTGHRGERGDGSIVVAYTARDEAAPSTDGVRPLPRLLRLDLVQPELAAKAVELLLSGAGMRPPERIGLWHYWSRGLAVHAAPASEAMQALTLVGAGDAARFAQELASP